MQNGWPRHTTMAKQAALKPLPHVSRLGSADSAHSKVPAQKGANFSMLETNMRVVGRGPALRLAARTAQVDGTDMSPELLQKLCGRLRQRHGLAAVPDPRVPTRLIVATRRLVEPLSLTDDGLGTRGKGCGSTRGTAHPHRPSGSHRAPTVGRAGVYCRHRTFQPSAYVWEPSDLVRA